MYSKLVARHYRVSWYMRTEVLFSCYKCSSSFYKLKYNFIYTTLRTNDWSTLFRVTFRHVDSFGSMFWYTRADTCLMTDDITDSMSVYHRLTPSFEWRQSKFQTDLSSSFVWQLLKVDKFVFVGNNGKRTILVSDSIPFFRMGRHMRKVKLHAVYKNQKWLGGKRFTSNKEVITNRSLFWEIRQIIFFGWYKNVSISLG